ncbi:MAG: RNA-binding protein [Candidatus Altiarchaeales archaeon HGW-Altiarchaeales-3]|nr:MAG: RNA-binding protein [Candidatus Altiarchaeales archaeon HGW-Altiarchaeales-3]
MKIDEYLKKDYITNLINEGKRIDERAYDEYRNLEIIKGYVNEKAEGSALVKLGDTQVLVGVKMDVGQPYPDRPTEGIMSINSELRPGASPDFELGPPRAESIELSRVVDRGIRESGAIKTKELFIEEDKVWVVFIDLHILDHGGNLIDAAGIAAITALLDARMPKYEDNVVIRGEWEGKLPVGRVPIPCTVAKISKSIISDPSLDEEYASAARLTIATTDKLNAMQKGGVGTFTRDEIMNAVDLAFVNGDKIRKLVE